MQTGPRRLIVTALLIALSSVGAAIKFPSLTGTPALDALPAFLAALLLGPGTGALVAALGHLFTAALSGFPLTLPVHLFIALEMAGVAAGGGWVNARSGPWLAGAWLIVANGLLAPALFIPWPGFGLPFFTAMLAPLLLASVLNTVGALAVYRALLAARAPLAEAERHA